MILNVIVTESLIRGRKLNIYFVCITQSYFVVPKNIRLNALFYYENSKKTRILPHCISSIIRYCTTGL